MVKQKYIKQFRLVILDDYDNPIEILYLSNIYEPSENKIMENDYFKQLIELDIQYDLANNYDEMPTIEAQANWGDGWKYWRDPVEDFMNL